MSSAQTDFKIQKNEVVQISNGGWSSGGWVAVPDVGFTYRLLGSPEMREYLGLTVSASDDESKGGLKSEPAGSNAGSDDAAASSSAAQK